MATTNSVNVGLSGASGTGNFVGTNSPTLVTPTLGVATATSLAFSPTTNGIVGTTAADNASAGYVGEVFSSQIVQGSAVALTTATAKTVTSLTLSAGDWDVFGNVSFGPGATTTITVMSGGISIVNNTLPDNSLISRLQITFTTGSNGSFAVPSQRINVNGSTTVYLIAQSTFAISTMGGYGSIYARRAR